MKTPAAFTHAVAALPFPPPDLPKFWDVWLRRATHRRLQRAVLDVLIAAYPAFIQIRIFGGVAGIAAAGYIRQFVPEGLPFPPKASANPTGPLMAWLKSNQGYVDDPVELPPVATRTQG